MTGGRRGSPTEHTAIFSGNRMLLESVRAPITDAVRVPAPARLLPYPLLFAFLCTPFSAIGEFFLIHLFFAIDVLLIRELLIGSAVAAHLAGRVSYR
jgi:hypothetical protein